MSLWNRLMNGIRAFREEDFAAEAGAPIDPNQGWGDWGARQNRYAIYWAMYRNDSYRKVHTFAQRYKTQYGLYRHTRGCYSPSARLANFYRVHLQGGPLDPDAGDGSTVPSALPIDAPDARIRPALARLWWDSNWAVKRGVFNLWGAVLGDVDLAVCDAPDLGLVSLEAWHPATMKWQRCDARGELTAYVRQETRLHPEQASPTAGPYAVQTARSVTFTEIAELRGDSVHYRTYLDGTLYPWNGVKGEWDAPYPFIPVFPVRHIDTGQGWGESEFEAARAKIDEVNDLGSKLHDQVRRMVEGAFAIGTKKPAPDRSSFGKTPATADNPEPDRGDMKLVWLGDQQHAVGVHSLIGNLNIADTSAEIRQALDNLEDDYPELRFERLRTGGEVTGEALRVARQPAAARVEERRPAYDYAFMQACAAAIAIGGWRGYDGYEGFDLSAYSVAKPPFRIKERPVFAVEEADRVADKLAKGQAIAALTGAGVPLPLAMQELGYDEAAINEAVRQKDEADAKAAKLAADTKAKAMAGPAA